MIQDLLEPAPTWREIAALIWRVLLNRPDPKRVL